MPFPPLWLAVSSVLWALGLPIIRLTSSLIPLIVHHTSYFIWGDNRISAVPITCLSSTSPRSQIGGCFCFLAIAVTEMLSAVSINTSTISKNSVQAVDQTLPYKIFPTVLLSVYQSLLNNFHSLEVISYANFSARTMFILIIHLCFNVHHYFFCILKNHIGKYNVSIYSQFLLLTIFLYPTIHS